MKDFLGGHRWVNMFPGNPTQNRYSRFVKQPSGELKTRFNDSAKEFEKIMKNKLKTHYHDEVWDD